MVRLSIKVASVTALRARMMISRADVNIKAPYRALFSPIREMEEQYR